MRNQTVAKTQEKLLEINNPLLVALLKKQKSLRLSDEKMALTLNCSRALWQAYRSHPERFPKFYFLRGIVSNHPELCIAIIDYLRGDGSVA